MSIPVELAELSEAAAKHHFAYLVSLSDQGHAHVVAVQPIVTESGVMVEDLGRRSMRNTVANPLVTLVWPPSDVGGYSLIVDGEVEASTDEGSITLRPSRAVLHRPVPGPHDDSGHVCGHDCVEVHVSAG